MIANERQVGGQHYQMERGPQHWDIVAMLGWDYYIGAATKYLWRLGRKEKSLDKQIEAIQKSIHYLEKKIELLQAEREAAGEPGLGYVDQDR